MIPYVYRSGVRFLLEYLEIRRVFWVDFEITFLFLEKSFYLQKNIRGIRRVFTPLFSDFSRV